MSVKPAPTPSHEVKTVLIAIHDFNNRSEDELTFVSGEQIQVIENDFEFKDGWYIGKRLITGATGLFPRVFASTVDELMDADGHQDVQHPVSGPTTPAGSNPGSRVVSQSQQSPSVTKTLTDIDEVLSELNNHTSQLSVTKKASVNGDLDPARVMSWTPFQVARWFENRGFDPAIPKLFVEHKISGAILTELELQHLKELDITSFGTRFEVYKEIEKLRGDPMSPRPTSGGTNRRSSTAYVSPKKGHMRKRSQSLDGLDSPRMNHEFGHSTEFAIPQGGTIDDFGFDEDPQHRRTPSSQQRHSQSEPQTQRSSVHDPRTSQFQQQHQQQHSRGRSSMNSSTNGSRQSVNEPPKHDLPSLPRKNTLDGNGDSRQSKESVRDFPRKSRESQRPPLQHAHSSHSTPHSVMDSPQLQRHPSAGHSLSSENATHLDSDSLSSSPEPKSRSSRRSSLLDAVMNAPLSPSKRSGRDVGSSDPDLTLSPINQKDQRSETIATPPTPKRTGSGPFRTLRKTPSASNVRSKSLSSKQKTSAFREGIKHVDPHEAAKNADFSGWMSKKGSQSVGTWKQRYFCLTGTRLSYFASLNDTYERGLIDLTAHKVVPARDNEDKLVALYASGTGAGRYCFKLLPPAPGSKKGLMFTVPKVHYFAVDTAEEMRGWMNAFLKATIDRDDSVPIVSSCVTPTVTLNRAQEMLQESHKNMALLQSQLDANGGDIEAAEQAIGIKTPPMYSDEFTVPNGGVTRKKSMVISPTSPASSSMQSPQSYQTASPQVPDMPSIEGSLQD
ncbi:Protein BOI2 [Yarrowia sp. C11]|nr:Protein BOI2 [Yarrowia sp. E02]KAG5369338.1 Protein BOI2 [Yarrowia sp. C11]